MSSLMVTFSRIDKWQIVIELRLILISFKLLCEDQNIFLYFKILALDGILLITQVLY